MFKPITLNILALLILCAAGYVYYKNRAYYYYENARTFDFFGKGGAYHLAIYDKDMNAKEFSAKEYLNTSDKRLQLSIDKQSGLTSQGALKVSLKRLKDATDAYNATVAEDQQEQELIATLLKEEEAQKEVNATLDRELRDKSDELRFFQNNPDMVNEWKDKVRIAENSMDEIRVLDKEIKELNTMVSNREQNLDNLTNKNTGLEGNIADLKAHILSRSDGRSIEGLKTKIRAVYNSWGFVTLSDGDKTGVVLNSTLDVVREGEVIAKLLVTIVEQNTASANIVPGSMAPDTFLMIGDLVVPAEVGMPGDLPAGAAPAAAP